jgi:hypothetical protein
LFIDFEKACNSVKREVLYNVPVEFGMPMKLVRPVEMYLNKTCSKLHVDKNVSDAFPIQYGLKQGDSLLPLLFKFALEYAIGKDWN